MDAGAFLRIEDAPHPAVTAARGAIVAVIMNGVMGRNHAMAHASTLLRAELNH
jgi:hypothetical protein